MPTDHSGPAAAGSTPAIEIVEESLIACHDCDGLYPWPQLKPGQRVRCARCGLVLLECKPGGIERSLSLTLASLILFVVANAFPIMQMSIEGRAQDSTILAGVEALFRQGYGLVAGLVFVVSILAPSLKLLGRLYVLLPLQLRRPLPYSRQVFRWVATLGPWAMTEVYLLGVLVAIVKLVDLATITPGLALYSFVGLIVLMAAADSVLEPHEVWERLGWRH